MVCKYFGKCGSCTLYGLNYQQQKELKIENSKINFDFLQIKDFVFCESKNIHYRARAEFIIWHDDENVSYAMHGLNTKEVVKIENCPKVVENIYNLMPKLLEMIKKCQVLRFKLFAVEFLSTKDETLVTLLYHKKIDESFDEYAKMVEKELNIKVIARSRGVKRVISDDFVYEILCVDKKEIKYKMYDTGFTQPNTFINEKMIGFVLDEIKGQKRDDMLELYCGHGNFTLPLSYYFDRVLATEISKTSIKAANENSLLNNIGNIEFIRLSSEEFADAYSEKREFKRLKDIKITNYNFSHILVDPPRSGLDEISRNLVKNFKNIIYISCNQESLK
ncbi:MAG: tRNA (uridine(54)-C5)-methyltransferase TrmA, partial [Campylobacteraceae bacterium]|nr:tRNA (uridine(54)-C5)-methyltransferase TrmA [Campylobacteraceae bacterium]